MSPFIIKGHHTTSPAEPESAEASVGLEHSWECEQALTWQAHALLRANKHVEFSDFTQCVQRVREHRADRKRELHARVSD